MTVFTEEIDLTKFNVDNYSLSVKCDNVYHPLASGNKYRKLKYNFLKAKKDGVKTILTFGGAYSNHLYAVAAAGKKWGLNTIGVIRGKELEHSFANNPTLKFCHEQGMEFLFVTREDYRLKENLNFIESLKRLFGEFYLLPEGGTNELAVKGCEEIIDNHDREYDYICVPVGTGGTISGIIRSSGANQKIIGFSALKGNFQRELIQRYVQRKNYEIIDDYVFGGYGKIDSELIRFINKFKTVTEVSLDPVYTGKMMFGILEMMKKNRFKKEARILAIHTGGLQGIKGVNAILKRKNLELIR